MRRLLDLRRSPRAHWLPLGVSTQKSKNRCANEAFSVLLQVAGMHISAWIGFMGPPRALAKAKAEDQPKKRLSAKRERKTPPLHRVFPLATGAT